MTNGVPINWCVVKLVETVEILDRYRVPVNNKERESRLSKATRTYPYYGATGQVGEIDDYIFDGVAVLLGEDGAPFLEPFRQKAYLVSGKYWVNNHAHVLRGNGAVDNAFLCHQLNVIDYRQHVSGTTRLKLTQSSMKELPLQLPPLNEQRRIVEKIETLFAELDQGEAALRKVQTLLARYRQAVLKAAFSGQLTAAWRAENAHRLEHGRDLLERILQARRENWQGRGKYKEPVAPDTTDMPELPDGWEWASLDSLCIYGPTNGISPKESFGSGCLSFKLSATTSGRFVINDETVKLVDLEPEARSKYWLQSGDVLVQRGNSMEYVGTAAIFPGPDNKYIYPDLMMRIRFAESLLAEWSVMWINSGYAKRHFRRLATGTAGNMPKINGMTLRTLGIPLPSSKEMHKIIDLLYDVDARIASVSTWCQSELVRSTALRQSILRDAFAGRLVPQDPNDEPADKLLARIRAARESASKKTTRKKAKA